MALNFPNVSLLGLAQESRILGAGFHYANSKRLSINGLITDLPATFGITGVWTGSLGMLATIANNANFQALTLNGVNFGSGRITSLTFSPDGISNDVKTKGYTAELVVQESGDLFNLTGHYYSGINTTNWQYLNSFNEDYQFQRKDNGGYSYTHSANIQFSSGVGATDAIVSAKALARSLFTGSNLGFAFYSGYTNKLGKRFNRESYDLIDNTCSFDETFEFDADSGDYSVTRTNQFQLATDGIITVAENGQIRGIVDPTYRTAQAALAGEMGGAYDRCNTVFGLYAPADPYPLISSPLVSSRTIDIFTNNLAYGVTFSNDISNYGAYTWDYTQQISYADDITRVAENGTILGRGNKTEAYNAALAGYEVVKAGAPARTAALYAAWVGSPYYFLDTQQIKWSPVKGAVEYGYNYSNEPVMVGTDGIKRIDTAIANERPIYMYGRFAIFNEKEIVQDQQQETEGASTISVALLGEKSVPLSAYLSNAKTVVNAIVGSGYAPYNTTGYFLEDSTYTFNPNENGANVNVRYRYNKLANQIVAIE